MTFQFLCPQGHLLEGEEAHMGMQCECPQCGTAFIIPTIGEQAPAPSSPAGTADALGLAPIEDDASDLAQLEPAMLKAPAHTARVESAPIDERELEDLSVTEPLLHIPCPNGHELETPLDMLNQRVMCPQCGVEFRLRREKSLEYQRLQEIEDRRTERFWFQLAVIAAGFVGVVLVAMIIYSAMRR